MAWWGGSATSQPCPRGWGMLMLPQTKLWELPSLWGMLSQRPPFTFLLKDQVKRCVSSKYHLLEGVFIM